jgi:hypothetical protein
MIETLSITQEWSIMVPEVENYEKNMGSWQAGSSERAGKIVPPLPTADQRFAARPGSGRSKLVAARLAANE